MQEDNKKKWKVLRFKINNFKGISDVEVDLNGKSVFIIGENSLGKTSTIDAIWATLSNKRIPKKPIKEGAEEANVMVIIGADGLEYTVQRTYREGKEDKLEITSPDGFKTSKIANLEGLVGDIGLDIMHFVDLCKSAEGRRDQLKDIRSLIDEDVNKRIDGINLEIKTIESERTEINKQIRSLKVLTDVEFSEGELEKYKDPVETDKVMAELQEVNAFNTKLKNAIQRRDESGARLGALEAQMVELQKKIDEEKQKFDGIDLEIRDNFIDQLDPKPTAELEEKLKTSSDHNRKHEDVKKYKENLKALETQNDLYTKRTNRRTELEEEKMKLFRESKLPVPDLTYNEEGLIYKGLPLHEDQQSTSELIMIGVKLAIAKLKKSKEVNKHACFILRVNRAESLGTARLNAIIQTAHEEGCQVFFDEVRRNQEELKIEYIEPLNGQ